MEIKGLKEFQRRLESLSQRVSKVSGSHQVPFSELFPNSFMSAHTKFPTIQEMADQGNIESEDDFHSENWNRFVIANTSFHSWEEMQKAAALEWTRKQLSF